MHFYSFYNLNNKIVVLSNMADIFFEKFTRRAKVFFYFLLCFSEADWLGRRTESRHEVSSYHHNLLVHSVEVLQLTQANFECGWVGVFDPDCGCIVFEVNCCVFCCYEDVRCTGELALRWNTKRRS